MNKQDFLNENYSGKFPISANTFDFMQSQTEFVSKIAAAFGNNVILKKPTTNNRDGLIVINGELMPLQYSSPTTGYYKIEEEKESIVAQNTEYTDARITRYAVLRSIQTSYPKSSFVDLTGGSYTQPTTLANHFLPKGAIIMWSGSWNSESIPKGFVLCNGNNGQPVNGVTIPDLRGKFIVGGNGSDSDFNTLGSVDSQGNPRGSKTHTLTINEIPEHTHTYSDDSYANKEEVFNYGITHVTYMDDISVKATKGSGGGGIFRTGKTGNNQPFKHLPPYYVLAFIIKVI